MDDKELKETLDVHTASIQGLMDNQLLLAAQVQVLQAALATVLLHLHLGSQHQLVVHQPLDALGVHLEHLLQFLVVHGGLAAIPALSPRMRAGKSGSDPNQGGGVLGW